MNNYSLPECSRDCNLWLPLSSSKNAIVNEHVFTDVAVVFPKLSIKEWPSKGELDSDSPPQRVFVKHLKAKNRERPACSKEYLEKKERHTATGAGFCGCFAAVPSS